MSHVLLRVLVNFYIYGWGVFLWLVAVNSWRGYRGYRTTLERSHEED